MATEKTQPLVQEEKVKPEPTADERFRALQSRMDDLELQLLNFTSPPPGEPAPSAPLKPGVETLASVMVGAFFNCPECGTRLDGPSLTSIQGSKGANYSHTFAESQKLSGQRCRLSGQQFKSPIVLLEFVNPPKPADLTAAK